MRARTRAPRPRARALGGQGQRERPTDPSPPPPRPHRLPFERACRGRGRAGNSRGRVQVLTGTRRTHRRHRPDAYCIAPQFRPQRLLVRVDHGESRHAAGPAPGTQTEHVSPRAHGQRAAHGKRARGTRAHGTRGRGRRARMRHARGRRARVTRARVAQGRAPATRARGAEGGGGSRGDGEDDDDELPLLRYPHRHTPCGLARWCPRRSRRPHRPCRRRAPTGRRALAVGPRSLGLAVRCHPDRRVRSAPHARPAAHARVDSLLSLCPPRRARSESLPRCLPSLSSVGLYLDSRGLSTAVTDNGNCFRLKRSTHRTSKAQLHVRTTHGSRRC